MHFIACKLCLNIPKKRNVPQELNTNCSYISSLTIHIFSFFSLLAHREKNGGGGEECSHMGSSLNLISTKISQNKWHTGDLAAQKRQGRQNKITWFHLLRCMKSFIYNDYSCTNSHAGVYRYTLCWVPPVPCLRMQTWWTWRHTKSLKEHRPSGQTQPALKHIAW